MKNHQVFYGDNETPCWASGMIEDIIYHTPQGEGDRHFVDIFFSDGKVCRYFKIDEIGWDTHIKETE